MKPRPELDPEIPSIMLMRKPSGLYTHENAPATLKPTRHVFKDREGLTKVKVRSLFLVGRSDPSWMYRRRSLPPVLQERALIIISSAIARISFFVFQSLLGKIVMKTLGG